MKTLTGEIVEVGTCEDGEGTSLGVGAWLTVEGSNQMCFVPLTEDEAREFGGMLYQSVTITISKETSK